jgi:hypothetical protein
MAGSPPSLLQLGNITTTIQLAGMPSQGDPPEQVCIKLDILNQSPLNFLNMLFVDNKD